MKNILIIGKGKTGLSVEKYLKKEPVSIHFFEDHKNISPTDALYDIDTLVVSPSTPLSHPLYQAALARGIPIRSDFDFFFEHDCCCIGITGTNGKSTTTALMGYVLKNIRNNVYVGGNIGVPVLDLEINQNGIYVLELSSYQCEHAHKLPLKAAILLNITPDHLDHHGSMKNYVAAKSKIFDNAEYSFIGIDDLYTQDLYNLYQANKSIITFSTKGPADFWIHDHHIMHCDHVIMNLKECALKGEHNWQNILAVVACLLTLGYHQHDVCYWVKTFTGLEHRQEIVDIFDDVLFVNDSKGTNADATENALKAYLDHDIYWIAGGVEKEGGISSLHSYIPFIKRIYLIGAAAENFKAFLQNFSTPFCVAETLEVATHIAFHDALNDLGSKPKVVLFSPACASFDQFKNFEERGYAFKKCCAFEKNKSNNSTTQL
ncbi:MAG: UDP-N-acetylmuramoylalanine--D-glutamate ligase [Holosporales bacterium]